MGTVREGAWRGVNDWPEIEISSRAYRRITAEWEVRYGIPWPLSWCEKVFLWCAAWCEEAAWRIRQVGEEHRRE